MVVVVLTRYSECPNLMMLPAVVPMGLVGLVAAMPLWHPMQVVDLPYQKPRPIDYSIVAVLHLARRFVPPKGWQVAVPGSERPSHRVVVEHFVPPSHHVAVPGSERPSHRAAVPSPDPMD